MKERKGVPFLWNTV